MSSDNREKTSLNPSQKIRDAVLEAYPLGAVGRRLMFGARKGDARTALDWFYTILDIKP